MSVRWEAAPEEVEHRSYLDGARYPHCGRCKRRLADVEQYRCPYVSCRVWLKTATEIEELRARRPRATERMEDHA